MKKNIDIYVDQLNLITFFKILFKFDRNEIHRIYYDNYLLPKILLFFFKNIKLINISKLRFSRISLKKNNL